MLILTRRPNQIIKIDGIIEVKVLTINPDYVAIGITAPKHIRVNRLEVEERMEKELLKS